MRLIYFHRLELSGSGQTIQVLRDYHALAALGETVHLICRDDSTLARVDLNRFLSEFGLSGLPSLHFHFLKEGARGKRRLQILVDQLIDEGHNTFLVCRTLDHAASALKLRDRHPSIKVLLELHETAIPHLVYQEQGRRLRVLLSRVREAHVFRKVDGLIATVPSQLELLDRLYPGHAISVVLPNGVPAVRLRDSSARRAIDERGVVRLRYAGHLNAWKNIGLMIEALRELPERFVLEIAGGKAEREAETRLSLSAKAERAGVGSRVRYLGFLAPARVPDFLVGADILLLPLGNNVQSRYFTSPMKLFEYAASGVPIVAVRQPTTQSLVVHEREALMVEPMGVAMARAIEQIASDDMLAKRLAANARTWVAGYTLDERASRYQKFICKLQGGNGDDRRQ